MAYDLEWEPNGVVFRYHGTVTDDDLTESNEEIYADPHFPQMRFQIVDFSKIVKFAVSSRAVAGLAVRDQEASASNPDVKVAIVTSEPFLYGMSRMYSRSHQAMGGTWRVKMFDTEEQAREWVEQQ